MLASATHFSPVRTCYGSRSDRASCAPTRRLWRDWRSCRRFLATGRVRIREPRCRHDPRCIMRANQPRTRRLTEITNEDRTRDGIRPQPHFGVHCVCSDYRIFERCSRRGRPRQSSRIKSIAARLYGPEFVADRRHRLCARIGGHIRVEIGAGNGLRNGFSGSWRGRRAPCSTELRTE